MGPAPLGRLGAALGLVGLALAYKQLRPPSGRLASGAPPPEASALGALLVVALLGLGRLLPFSEEDAPPALDEVAAGGLCFAKGPAVVQDSAGESTIDHLGPGQHVVAAGPVKLVRGRRMLPVEPAGLVETGRLESLRLGDWVRMDGKLIGTVQFVGTTHFAGGEWVGVMCYEPIGKNDGEVGGVRYFTGAPNHGLFCRPRRLRFASAPKAAPPAPADTGADAGAPQAPGSGREAAFLTAREGELQQLAIDLRRAVAHVEVEETNVREAAKLRTQVGGAASVLRALLEEAGAGVAPPTKKEGQLARHTADIVTAVLAAEDASSRHFINEEVLAMQTGEADRTARLELAEASRRRLRFELHAASAVLANFLGGGAPFHRRLARPLARGPAADAIADGALGDGALRPLGGAAPGGVLRPLGGDSLAAMQQRAAALRPGGGGPAQSASAASGDGALRPCGGDSSAALRQRAAALGPVGGASGDGSAALRQGGCATGCDGAAAPRIGRCKGAGLDDCADQHRLCEQGRRDAAAASGGDGAEALRLRGCWGAGSEACANHRRVGEQAELLRIRRDCSECELARRSRARAAQLALAEAVADNDLVEISKALAKASSAEVPPKERESAQRVLEFELLQLQGREAELAAMPDDIRRELLAEEARRTERARTMREKAKLKVHCKLVSQREEIGALERELERLSSRHMEQLAELGSSEHRGLRA